MNDAMKLEALAESIRHHPNLQLQRLAAAILEVGGEEIAPRLLGFAPHTHKTDKEA
jgi:hypothetical protein